MARLCELYNCTVLDDGHGMGEGQLTDMKAGYVAAWLDVIQPLIGREVTTEKMHGTSDARHFYANDIEVLVTNALHGEIHQPGEWTDLESITTLAHAMYLYQLALVQNGGK